MWRMWVVVLFTSIESSSDKALTPCFSSIARATYLHERIPWKNPTRGVQDPCVSPSMAHTCRRSVSWRVTCCHTVDIITPPLTFRAFAFLLMWIASGPLPFGNLQLALGPVAFHSCWWAAKTQALWAVWAWARLKITELRWCGVTPSGGWHLVQPTQATPLLWHHWVRLWMRNGPHRQLQASALVHISHCGLTA